MSADTPRLRLGILGIVAVSLFAALFARLWFLQVLAAPQYKLLAQRNQIREVVDPAPRGRILDRQGRVLVQNIASNVVFIDPTKLTPAGRPPLLAQLAPVLHVPIVQLAQRLDDPRVSPYTPVPVAENVTEDVMIWLQERRDRFPAVDARQVAVRNYPNGPLAAHILGYVGEINQDELKARPGYHLGDAVGKAGVEKQFEADLRGKDGIVRVEVDAKNKPVRVLSRRTPEPGNDVVLSVDIDVQRVAEQSLAEGLAAARGRRFADTKEPLKADAGAAVVLDDKEGTVIALASYPTFDPTVLVNGISTQEFRDLTDPAKGTPFLDRATQGQYLPGSTWKLVTATAGLRTGAISPLTTVVDKGSFQIPGQCTGSPCSFRNAGGNAYGPVDLRKAIAVSSDVYFYTLGYRFWNERGRFGDTAIQDTAKDLGFGQLTNVQLPDEGKGLVITPALRAQRHNEKPKVFIEGKWFPGDNVNLAIGQGELAVTPLQLANAYATFADGGTRWAPNLGLEVRRPGGAVVRKMAPRVAGRVDLPPSVRDPILQGLEGATTDPKGTATSAFVGFPMAQYPVAGKTGTAQVTPGKQDTALFTAIAPATDPRYVVTVVMEQAGFGATSAAPVARRLLGQLSGLELAPPPIQLVAGGRG